jgi:hypothetical protein
MIFAIITIVLAIFVWAVYSSVRSVLERRIPRQLAFLSDELIRGAQSQLSTRDEPIPRAVVQLNRSFKQALSRPATAQHPALWELGNAIGEACWQNGYAEGLKVGATPPDKIRIELTVDELLHMSWLAHLGFQYMMPNYRGFELHRFKGAEDAKAGARAVALLECALPRNQRPFSDITQQLQARDKMISDWWVQKPQAIAG